jgi:hypothetical protein
MSWTAPEVAEPQLLTVSAERAALEEWLGYQRATLLYKCSGLTGEQLSIRSVEPSSMSLLGLIRHMAEVERSWFRRRLLNDPELPFLYFVPDVHDDADFDLTEPANAEEDYAVLLNEIRWADEAAATKQLDDTFVHHRDQKTYDLRWVYIHMIEEYARHNGHADLLRERIDGKTDK